MSAGESGRVALTAETETMGPGYHRFIGRLVERMGDGPVDHVGPRRARPGGDPGQRRDDVHRPGRDRACLPRLARPDAGQGPCRPGRHGAQLQVGIPGTTRYTFDGAIATVLGPRDDAWLDAAVADTRVATDITPWWADATDGQTLVNRALTLMWLDVRWRAPAIKEERELMDEVHRTLTAGLPERPDPRLPVAGMGRADRVPRHRRPDVPPGPRPRRA